MTTITIIKSKSGNYKGMTCSGHAGYANAGNDIVCAAVSMLVINTINSLETLTGTQMQVFTNQEEGYIDCKFLTELNEGGTLLMDSLILGLNGTVEEYGKKFLKVKFKEV